MQTCSDSLAETSSSQWLIPDGSFVEGINSSFREGTPNKPSGMSRTYGKRPDGLTLISWQRGKSLAWDITVVNTRWFSYLSCSVVSSECCWNDDREEDFELRYFACKRHLSASCLWDAGSDQSIWSRFYFWNWSQTRASIRCCPGTLLSFPTAFHHCPVIQLCDIYRQFHLRHSLIQHLFFVLVFSPQDSYYRGRKN